jgi:hypothetical protein
MSSSVVPGTVPPSSPFGALTSPITTLHWSGPGASAAAVANAATPGAVSRLPAVSLPFTCFDTRPRQPAIQDLSYCDETARQEQLQGSGSGSGATAAGTGAVSLSALWLPSPAQRWVADAAASSGGLSATTFPPWSSVSQLAVNQSAALLRAAAFPATRYRFLAVAGLELWSNASLPQLQLGEARGWNASALLAYATGVCAGGAGCPRGLAVEGEGGAGFEAGPACLVFDSNGTVTVNATGAFAAEWAVATSLAELRVQLAHLRALLLSAALNTSLQSAGAASTQPWLWIAPSSIADGARAVDSSLPLVPLTVAGAAAPVPAAFRFFLPLVALPPVRSVEETAAHRAAAGTAPPRTADAAFSLDSLLQQLAALPYLQLLNGSADTCASTALAAGVGATGNASAANVSAVPLMAASALHLLRRAALYTLVVTDDALSVASATVPYSQQRLPRSNATMQVAGTGFSSASQEWPQPLAGALNISWTAAVTDADDPAFQHVALRATVALVTTNSAAAINATGGHVSVARLSLPSLAFSPTSLVMGSSAFYGATAAQLGFGDASFISRLLPELPLDRLTAGGSPAALSTALQAGALASALATEGAVEARAACATITALALPPSLGMGVSGAAAAAAAAALVAGALSGSASATAAQQLVLVDAGIAGGARAVVALSAPPAPPETVTISCNLQVNFATGAAEVALPSSLITASALPSSPSVSGLPTALLTHDGWVAGARAASIAVAVAPLPPSVVPATVRSLRGFLTCNATALYNGRPCVASDPCVYGSQEQASAFTFPVLALRLAYPFFRDAVVETRLGSLRSAWSSDTVPIPAWATNSTGTSASAAASGTPQLMALPVYAAEALVLSASRWPQMAGDAGAAAAFLLPLTGAANVTLIAEDGTGAPVGSTGARGTDAAGAALGSRWSVPSRFLPGTQVLAGGLQCHVSHISDDGRLLRLTTPSFSEVMADAESAAVSGGADGSSSLVSSSERRVGITVLPPSLSLSQLDTIASGTASALTLTAAVDRGEVSAALPLACPPFCPGALGNLNFTVQTAASVVTRRLLSLHRAASPDLHAARGPEAVSRRVPRALEVLPVEAPARRRAYRNSSLPTTQTAVHLQAAAVGTRALQSAVASASLPLTLSPVVSLAGLSLSSAGLLYIEKCTADAFTDPTTGACTNTSSPGFLRCAFGEFRCSSVMAAV